MRCWTLSLLLSFLLPIAAADELALVDSARLTGTVQALRADGTVEILTPHCPTPLKLPAHAVNEMRFNHAKESPLPKNFPSSRIELTNGNILPAELRALDEATAHVWSPDFGDLQIPRSGLRSIEYGIIPLASIYQPTDTDDWVRSGDGNQAWSIEGELLVANGNGSIARILSYPDQYRIAFELQWTDQPNFQLLFGGTRSSHQAGDRYGFVLNHSGIELKREASTGRQNTTLAQFNRRPEQMSDQKLQVEIRVDRNSGRLHLFLNGKSEGRFRDPLGTFPAGDALELVSSTNVNVKQVVSGLTVTAWNDLADRQRAEDRGDASQDSVITRSGERYSGILDAVTASENSPRYRFQTKYQDQAIEPPEEEISMILFASAPAPESTNEPSASFRLSLRGGGTLSAQACEFSQTEISLTHAIFGHLTLERGALTGIDQLRSTQAETREASPALLRLQNADQLPGSIGELTMNSLTWESPLLIEEAIFPIEAVQELVFKNVQTNEATGHQAVLTLTNGDKVRGDLKAMASDTISLETWYAGHLEIRRPMVNGLEIEALPKVIYRNLQGLEGWNLVEHAKNAPWEYQADGFTATSAAGAMYQQLPLPELFTVSFDAEWRNAFLLSVMLCVASVDEPNPTDGLELMFDRRRAQLRQNPGVWIGSTDAPMLQQDEMARFAIHVNRTIGEVVLTINEQVIEVWTDPTLPRKLEGNVIGFAHPGNSQLTISAITVSEWDGVRETPPPAIGNFRQGIEPAEPASDGAELHADHERMELRNGDYLSGEVLGMHEGKIEIKTPFAQVDLPLDRLKTIQLKPIDLEEPKRNRGDVRARMPDGTSLVFRLEKADNDTLFGYSQTFGHGQFRKEAFDRIEFNIYPTYEQIQSSLRFE